MIVRGRFSSDLKRKFNSIRVSRTRGLTSTAAFLEPGVRSWAPDSTHQKFVERGLSLAVSPVFIERGGLRCQASGFIKAARQTSQAWRKEIDQIPAST
jgi:hypothetical protein